MIGASMKRLLIFLVTASTGFAQQLNFPQDTVAYNDLFNNRQTVAFDSQGKLHIAYSGQVGTNSATREIYYVTENADSFITRNATTNAVDDNYPTLSLDRNDNVHIGFVGRDAGNIFQVQYSRLVNGLFTQPVFITVGGVNKATPYSTIGPDSVMHFVYFTNTTGSDAIYYRKYDLRDSTLSQEQTLTSGETSGDFDTGVATDSSGKVHIVVKSGGASGVLRYYSDYRRFDG